MTFLRRRLLLGIGATAAFAAGFASAVQAAERFDHTVRRDFFIGFSGNAEALARGMAACERVLAEDPKHAEALVWHGSGLFFQAGAAFRQGDMTRGMALSVQGQKEMDEAVALAPDNVGVRIPRGATLLAASRAVRDPQAAAAMLRKGRGDYEHVLELQKSQLDELGVHPKGELLAGIADAAGRMGDVEKAESYWRRIAAEMSGTPYGRRAELWLKTKSLPDSETGCIGCHVK